MSCEEFKKKAGETADYVADKSVELARCAMNKTCILAKMAAARADLALEREALKKSRVELGKAYYKQFGQDPENEMAETCAKVDASLKTIAAKKKLLADLKAQLKENPSRRTMKAEPNIRTTELPKNWRPHNLRPPVSLWLSQVR